MTRRAEFYVLRTGGRSGGRFWDGPYATYERAESALGMLTDRANAFIAVRLENGSEGGNADVNS